MSAAFTRDGLGRGARDGVPLAFGITRAAGMLRDGAAALSAAVGAAVALAAGLRAAVAVAVAVARFSPPYRALSRFAATAVANAACVASSEGVWCRATQSA